MLALTEFIFSSFSSCLCRLTILSTRHLHSVFCTHTEKQMKRKVWIMAHWPIEVGDLKAKSVRITCLLMNVLSFHWWALQTDRRQNSRQPCNQCAWIAPLWWAHTLLCHCQKSWLPTSLSSRLRQHIQMWQQSPIEHYDWCETRRPLHSGGVDPKGKREDPPTLSSPKAATSAARAHAREVLELQVFTVQRGSARRLPL